MKEEAVSPPQPRHSVAAIPPQCEPQPSSASWDLFPPPLPATQLKRSQTSEHADPKCCRLVTALLCRELPPGKELPLPPFLGGHGGVVAAGRCPCTFGARLGVFGHAPGTGSRAALGLCPGCSRAPRLRPPPGGCKQHPNVPLGSRQCTPAALRDAAPTPDTGGT